MGQPHEVQLTGMLQQRGVECKPQFPVGKYNIDIACGSVAVEVHRHSGQPHRRPILRERIEYLINNGWSVMYVWISPYPTSTFAPSPMTVRIRSPFVEESNRAHPPGSIPGGSGFRAMTFLLAVRNVTMSPRTNSGTRRPHHWPIHGYRYRETVGRLQHRALGPRGTSGEPTDQERPAGGAALTVGDPVGGLTLVAHGPPDPQDVGPAACMTVSHALHRRGRGGPRQPLVPGRP